MSDLNELITTFWIDGYDPARSMPAKIRRKAYYLNRAVMVPMPDEVMLIKVPRWFVEVHGLKIIEDHEKGPDYDI